MTACSESEPQRDERRMKVSIITATRNSAATVADCIASVNGQTHAAIEHLVIDGASQDDTVRTVEAMPNRVAKIVSEPDRGIYDAMNKGIALATGDVIGILNADDFLAAADIIELIAATFEREPCDAVFGNLDFVAPDHPDRVVRRWTSSPFVPGSFAGGWHPPHPTLYLRRGVYERYGTFDVALDVSADFELMLRLFERFGIRARYVDRTIVRMRYGGESTGSLRKIIRGNINIMRAFKKNGIRVSPLYPLMRLLPKLKEFLVR